MVKREKDIDVRRIVILGMGYAATAFATLAQTRGWCTIGTKRQASQAATTLPCVPFDEAADILAAATHILISTPPGADGDPAYLHYAAAIRAAPQLQWIGYYSTTGVYGDRAGARVDEKTTPAPAQSRSIARLNAENAWRNLARERAIACDVMRLGGIYGPGRSALDALRNGTARIINAPDHCFSRIHQQDIAEGTLAAIETARDIRILNFTDRLPSPQRDVFAEAARLLDCPLPTAMPLAAAWPEMSEMARSFWSERRQVDSRWTEASLRRRWRYPTYREGLAAILHDA